MSPRPALPGLQLPGGDALQFRALDLTRDLTTLHQWFAHPKGRFWGLTDKTLEQVRDIYAETIQRPGHQVLVGTLARNGQPVCLLEAYDPAKDGLGRLYRVQRGDLGLHLFIAPATTPSTAFSYYVLRAMCSHLLADRSVTRLVAEPDVRNAKVFARFRQAGFILGPVVYLPHKTGQLVLLTRERHAAWGAAGVPPKADYPLRRLWVRPRLLMGRIRRRLQHRDEG